MNRLTAVLLTSGIALGGFGMVNASPGGHGSHGHKGKYCQHGKHGKGRGAARLARMTKKLGLNDTQVKQIKAIKAKYAPQKTALRTKMKDTFVQLRKAMHADKIDSAQVEQLAQAAGNLKAKKFVLRAKMRSEVYSILTTEQRAKKKAMRKGRYGRHHGHHH